MQNTGEFTAGLKSLLRDRKLIPFVGSGLSKPLNLPSWDKLIEMIALQLGFDPEVFRLSGNYLQLAEYFVAERGDIGPLRSEMDRLFDAPQEKIRGSRAHNALVGMRVPVIYTTNYDRIIERAFELNGVRHHQITSIDQMATAPPGVTQIVKLHGTFDKDETLVLTESNYFDRLEFESALDIKLRADMLGNCLLFIGYSLSDINIRYMLYKLYKLKGQARPYASRVPSAYMVTFRASQVQRALLSRWDVSIIELDPSDKVESVATFLEGLT